MPFLTINMVFRWKFCVDDSISKSAVLFGFQKILPTNNIVVGIMDAHIALYGDIVSDNKGAH